MRATLCGLLSCFWVAHAHAGAWNLGAGDAELITGLRYYQADDYVNVRGNKQSQETYHKAEIPIYAAYGLSNDWMVGLNASAVYAQQDDSNVFASEQGNTGLAGTELWLQRPLYQEHAWVVSGRVSAGMARLYQTGDFPEIGRAQPESAIAMSVGWNMPSRWSERAHYVDGEIEYRKRFGDVGDQLNLSATVGLSPAQRWQVLGQLFHTEPLSNGFSTGRIDTIGDYELTKGQLSVLYWYHPDHAVQLGIFEDIRARNTGKGRGVVLGSWHRF